MPARIEWRESDAELVSLVREHGNTGLAELRGVSEHAVRSELRRRGLRPRDFPPDALSEDVEDPTEIPVIFREYPGPHHYLYPLGDVHIGAESHQARRWQEWVDYLVAQPDRSMLGTGDFLNTAIIGSKSDVYDETHTVGQAKRRLWRQLEPLRERIDGLMPGNHEDRVRRAVGDCPIEDIADILDVPYVRAAGLWVITVGEQTYRIYVRHGTGNGQSLAQLSKSAQVVEGCDLYITGHTHRQAVVPDDVFRFDGQRCVRAHRYCVNSGSFVGLEAYAAQRGYAPTRIGAPRIFLNGERHEVHVSL